MQPSPSFDIGLTITCAGIALISVLVALTESPSWQAVTAFIIMGASVVMVSYSLWRLRKDMF